MLLGMLSLFGAAMAVGTVFVIPSSIEPAFWLTIFATCGFLIAKKAPGKYFLHGLALSLINSVWVTSAHILFVTTYLANHPQEAAMTAKMPLPDSPRLMMAMMGPVIGLASGIVQGAIAWGVSRIVNRGSVAKAA
jgi:hypothetical protein